MQDLCEVAGGVQCRRIRGRTFTLWTNAVATNRVLPPGLQINAELAGVIQTASRAALAAIGWDSDEIAAKEYVELYPESQNQAVRADSRTALKAYHAALPPLARNLTVRWLALIVGQETAEARAALEAEKQQEAAEARAEAQPAAETSPAVGDEATSTETPDVADAPKDDGKKKKKR